MSCVTDLECYLGETSVQPSNLMLLQSLAPQKPKPAFVCKLFPDNSYLSVPGSHTFATLRKCEDVITFGIPCHMAQSLRAHAPTLSHLDLNLVKQCLQREVH